MAHDPEVQTGVRHGARHAALEHGGVLPPPELRVQAAGLGRERFGSKGCSPWLQPRLRGPGQQPFLYAAWFESLKAGRSFATNGPMLFLSADGQEPGSQLRSRGPRKVRIRVEALSPRPLERLEIVADGRVVQGVASPDRNGRWIVEVDHSFSHNGWVAARAFETPGGTIRFAHTSPIDIDLGRPVLAAAAARFFLEWIDREIGFYAAETAFRDPRHREEMLEFFRAARAVYARLAQQQQTRVHPDS